MIESKNDVITMINERTARRALIIIALIGLAAGLAATFTGHSGLARWIWAAGTIPVVAGLAISIARDVLAGRMGVDAVALVSMAAALALGQTLAGVVVAIMYAGGNLLEDFAVGRAERDLKSLIDRAPRVAHFRSSLAGSCSARKRYSSRRPWRCSSSPRSKSFTLNPVIALDRKVEL